MTVAEFFTAFDAVLARDGIETTAKWKAINDVRFRIDYSTHNRMDGSRDLAIYGFDVEHEGDISYARLSYYKESDTPELSRPLLWKMCAQLMHHFKPGR